MTAFEVAHHGQIFSVWGIDRETLGTAFRVLVLTVQTTIAAGIVWWAMCVGVSALRLAYRRIRGRA